MLRPEKSSNPPPRDGVVEEDNDSGGERKWKGTLTNYACETGGSKLNIELAGDAFWLRQVCSATLNK